ncbi:MAG TPA: proton-conducting transporter membrane subunit, partial [Ardenticatenaceae bacterium]|nr:proton-conducting transporter membrane subunit [Ardenticatenaceae bacterium]
MSDARAFVVAALPFAAIWLPIGVMPLVYALRRYSFVAAALSVAAVLLSGWFLWQQAPPAGEVLNRPLILSGMARALLLALSLWLAVTFVFAWRVTQGRSLFPFLLLAYALMSLALFFQELVIRVLILKIAWLATILLVHGGYSTTTRAASRLLVVTGLAVPPFLAAAVLIERYTLQPDLSSLVGVIAAALALGFSLMLAIIPFHAWLPQAAEDGPPLVAAFLVAGLSSAYLVLLVDLLGRYRWLADSPEVQTLLSSGGLLVAVLGGLLAFSETHLGRLWAYSALADLGYLLLGLGAGTVAGVRGALFVGAARLISLLLSGAALAAIRNRAGTLELSGLRGVGARLPLTLLALAIGGFGLLGLPLTAGFPGHWIVLRELMRSHPAWVWWLMAATGLAMLRYTQVFTAILRPAP